MAKKMEKIVNKRRIFLGNGEHFYHLLTFDQHKDGSIYCSLPVFKDICWQTISDKEIKPILVSETIRKEGKLSIHGTGMVVLRANDNLKGYRLIVKGNTLFNPQDTTIGVRHIFTLFSQKLIYKCPSSPAFNRKNDYVLNSNQTKPFAIIFLAVPHLKNLKVELNLGFDQEDLESIPPESGWGAIRLRYHDIIWFYYRTKHMDKWPKQTHICYDDGHSIPFYIGKTPGTDMGAATIVLCKPIYTLNENVLGIACTTEAIHNGINPECC